MKPFLSFFVLFFCTQTMWASVNATISSSVHDIDLGVGSESPLIFLTNGKVLMYPSIDKSKISLLRESILKKTVFIFTINKKKEIVGLNERHNPAQIVFPQKKLFENSQLYHPSILKNLSHAKNLFNSARPTEKEESQCFNRAHIWAYEWRLKENIYSSKVWIFFTRRFIRKYKFDWWFHIAPMVHVVTDREVKERIMDMKYAKGPLKLKQWTDIFMRDNSDCPVVDKYSDQANYPESGSCFIMKSSMYYYLPLDLEQSEILGTTKSRWHKSEVGQAYLEAFDVEL